jgi:hypothetical protein
VANKIITITIDENSDQTVETAGYYGKGCSAVTQAFADAVGQTAGPIRRKAEYNKLPTKQNKLER